MSSKTCLGAVSTQPTMSLSSVRNPLKLMDSELTLPRPSRVPWTLSCSMLPHLCKGRVGYLSVREYLLHIGSADPRFLSVYAPSTGANMPGGFGGLGSAFTGFGSAFTFPGIPATVSSSTTSAATSAASFHPLSTTSSATAQQDSAPISPTQSQGQGPASTSPLVTLNGSPSVTLSGDPMSESSAQVPVSLQPPENASAGIHRHALSTGVIVGVALVIVTVVLTLTIIFCRRHRRRDQPRMVSPFVHLTSGTSATQSTTSEIQSDASAARLQYFEKELRGARAEMVEIGTSTQIVERRVPDDAGGPVEEPTAEGSIPERASSNDQQSGADGATAALLARIRELESQIRGTRTSGVSDDPPPGGKRSRIIPAVVGVEGLGLGADYNSSGYDHRGRWGVYITNSTV
ncbi:hypothetical protein B0H13DRAFT_1917744 [Mycena leptocephala]|nr:hypothetical protein B0H13DRAFT_1917744 [Mycena leptocephala]